MSTSSLQNPSPRMEPIESTPLNRGRVSLRRAALVALLCLGGVAWEGSNRTSTGPASGTTLTAASAATGDSLPPKSTFRIASFNIHSGRGSDGRFDLNRTAATLAGYDFAGLNEVQGGTLTQSSSQAQWLGDRLQRAWLFAPTERRWWHEHFGNGALASVPVKSWSRSPLACSQGKGYRNTVLFEIRPWSGPHQDETVRVLLTHLDRQQDREAQLQAVIKKFISLAPPAILLGDLNTTVSDPQLQALLSQGDVQDAVGSQAEHDDAGRIDWILTRGVRVVSSGIKTGDTSDHPLVWAELERLQ